jgi:hypothetical protein
MAKQKSCRIIFEYRGKYHPFLSFWVDKNDNSFYFHIYRRPGETPMSSNDGPIQNGSRIDFQLFKPTGFNENKMSFHGSGYIHSTDKYGRRYRDGVRGIAFQKIETYLCFLLVAPPNPAHLVEIPSIDVNRDLQIHLPDDVAPFALQFTIIKKGTKTLPQIPIEECLFKEFIICEFTDKQFNLLLAATKVLKGQALEDVSWPKFPFVMKRIG